jgi:hypothetical protein
LIHRIEEESKKRVHAIAAPSNSLSNTLDAVVGNTSNTHCCVSMSSVNDVSVNDVPSEQSLAPANAPAPFLPAEEVTSGATGNVLLDKQEQQVQYALFLDLERCPRLSRSGETKIAIHKHKQAGET